MEINKETLRAFREDFNQAVQSLQEKYDVTISLGSITFLEERFSAKLTVTNGRDPEDVARNEFDVDVWKFTHLGLKPGMYNRVFMGQDGQRYAIRGFNTRARKWPIKMMRISDGENRVCSEKFIKKFLDEYYVDIVVVE
ncbi:MAG: hypothetical protein IKE58_10630 [Blautia sp.]|nr:hypothetical protein [Blautia sp.]